MSKLTKQPKKVGGWFYRKLPWYGKLLIPVVVLAGGIYIVQWLAAVLFGIQ